MGKKYRKIDRYVELVRNYYKNNLKSRVCLCSFVCVCCLRERERNTKWKGEKQKTGKFR